MTLGKTDILGVILGVTDIDGVTLGVIDILGVTEGLGVGLGSGLSVPGVVNDLTDPFAFTTVSPVIETTDLEKN